MKILLVEPIFENAKQYCKTIALHEGETEIQPSVLEAMMRIRTDKFHGVVISRYLPDMNGELFQKMLKDMENTANIPTLLVMSPDKDEPILKNYLRKVIESAGG